MYFLETAAVDFDILIAERGKLEISVRKKMRTDALHLAGGSHVESEVDVVLRVSVRMLTQC